MKTLILMLFLLPMVYLFGQVDLNFPSTDDEKLTDTRQYFSSITIGFIEFMSLSFGYQINDDFSISIKGENIAIHLGLGMTTGWGIGISGSYYFNDELINSIKLSVIPVYWLSYITSDKNLIKAMSVECTFNHEKLISHSLMFYYEIGGAISIPKDSDAWIGPSIKVGVLYNF